MHEWFVASGIIEGPAGILLVQNHRLGGAVDWSPPGGVIEEAEDVLGGLTREVVEETGLVVSEWSGPLYEIEAAAPGLGWLLRVEVWLANAYTGELVCADPDDIVRAARFVSIDECQVLIEGNHPWVVEPLTEYLADRWEGRRSYGYRIDGERLAELVVTRL